MVWRMLWKEGWSLRMLLGLGLGLERWEELKSRSSLLLPWIEDT